MDRLVCLGLSHRTAPVELRERVGSLGPGAEGCPAIHEHAVLSTCYRVELYAHLAEGVDQARDELIDVLAGAHGVERSLLEDHLYVYAGEDVTRHLCRVASGLDSLVLGEAEILGLASLCWPAMSATLPRRAGDVGQKFSAPPCQKPISADDDKGRAATWLGRKKGLQLSQA